MKFLILLTALYSVTRLSAQTNADILIKNGRILDGTGNSWFWGDVAVKDGKIIKVGSLQNIQAAKTIDAKGMVVAPGFIETDMTKKMPETVLQGMKEKVAVQRLGSPRDVANMYLFLSSSESNYVNGAVMPVDGGLSI